MFSNLNNFPFAFIITLPVSSMSSFSVLVELGIKFCLIRTGALQIWEDGLIKTEILQVQRDNWILTKISMLKAQERIPTMAN